MQYQVILKNDDKTPFLQVIGGLSAVCQIPLVQAEQIATLAHYNGSAIIKESVDEDLAYQYAELFERVGVPAEVILQDSEF